MKVGVPSVFPSFANILPTSSQVPPVFHGQVAYAERSLGVDLQKDSRQLFDLVQCHGGTGESEMVSPGVMERSTQF